MHHILSNNSAGAWSSHHAATTTHQSQRHGYDEGIGAVIHLVVRHRCSDRTYRTALWSVRGKRTTTDQSETSTMVVFTGAVVTCTSRLRWAYREHDDSRGSGLVLKMDFCDGYSLLDIECDSRAISNYIRSAWTAETIITDNPAWANIAEFRLVMSKNWIQHITSPAYHPSSNGLAERAVQFVKRGLTKTTDWSIEIMLARYMVTYRVTPQSTTGISPCNRLKGRPLRIS